MALAVFVMACGGGQAPAASPDPVEPVDEPVAAEPKSEAPSAEEPAEGEGGETAPKVAAEPQFTDDMSVDEAINAVPQGSERMNLDPEALGKPLMDMNVYKPCKLAPSLRFKIRVAVWDGRAVGVDVTSTPKNDKAVGCVKEQIKGLKWKDAIKSLNTVDYAF